VTSRKLNAQKLHFGRENVVIAKEKTRTIPQPSDLRALLDDLEKKEFGRRLWAKDGRLWKTGDSDLAQISNSLGWLELPRIMKERIPEISDFAETVWRNGFTHVVHMGMGGSSLAPLVFERLFAPVPPGLPIHILDSTDPSTIAQLERQVTLETTLFIVASKSGTTTEPSAFNDYFYDRLQTIKGDKAGENFVAITDPDTQLVELAQKRGFLKTFLNFSDVGGRYSALSFMGLVPAALMGLDVRKMVTSASAMAEACSSSVRESENPGIVLGALMGVMAKAGVNKLTFLMDRELSTVGMWLEQLIAESTGKEGTGILPVTGEPAAEPSFYADDRLFVSLREDVQVSDECSDRLEQLDAAGFPIVSIAIRDRMDVVQEFFRWEIATAVAGSVLRINPFDQPNVQEAKDATRKLLDRLEKNGSLVEPTPTALEGGLSLFWREGGGSIENILRNFLLQSREGDYFSIQAYIAEETETEGLIEMIRLRLRDYFCLATTVGYGPRLLHSTGQLHKGGPDSGLFIQLTAPDLVDLPIPGKPYTFGVLKRAQALGDYEALVQHGRRALRVDLGSDPKTGLLVLQGVLERTLSRA
jgi:glucose-6-phosphate isomerase